MNRRQFLGGAGVPTTAIVFAERTATATGLEASRRTSTSTSTGTDREYWAGVAARLAEPVLTNLAAGTLRARMPVE